MTTQSQTSPAPVAAAGASRVGALLALVVLAVGAVGIRDSVVAAGWMNGTQWLPTAINAVDGLAPGFWMVPAGGVLAVLGLAVMAVAVAPRRRTAIPLVAESAVYLSRSDVAKIASAAAQDVPGVLDARTSASRRKAVVRCRTTGDASQDLQHSIAAAVSDELGILAAPPRVVVRIRAESTS